MVQTRLFDTPDGLMMHGSATTTPDIRQAIQASPLSIRALAAGYGINPKTVAKWKSRTSTEDMPMGSPRASARKLSAEEEGTCIGFRIHTRLPLDDCLYALQLMMPHLTRSSLHRLYQRHRISRLPAVPGPSAETGSPSRRPPIGSFYVNAADIRTGDGKANMFFAFDRASKLAFGKLYESSDVDNGPAFLETLKQATPYAIESVLTGDSPLFSHKPTPEIVNATKTREHLFAKACRQHGIGHEILPFDQPWRIHRQDRRISGPAGSSDRKFHYQSHNHLQEHFFAFFDTYNFERRLKTLGGLTPYEYICDRWAAQPGLFRYNPVENRPRHAD
jgi:hypothetical protein